MRNPYITNSMVPIVRNLPFFRDRGLQDNAIADCLSLMTFKEVKQDNFVIEYGTVGDEFYVVLDGECEILVPDKATDEFNQINFELRCLREQLEKQFSEVQLFLSYQSQLMMKKQLEEQDEDAHLDHRQSQRRYTRVIHEEIPQAIQERLIQINESIAATKRYIWRRNYELMIPINKLG